MGCICLPYAATLMYGALVWTHPKKKFVLYGSANARNVGYLSIIIITITK